MRRFFLDVAPTLILLCYIFGWQLTDNYGRWVGDRYPAATPMVLTHAEKVADVIVFSGSSARLWPQCSFKKIVAGLGPRDAHFVPLTINAGPAILRGDGSFTFSGWIAKMDDLDAFKFNSFSDVHHRCRIFAKFDEVTNQWVGGWELPFDVVTKFYR